MVDDVKRISDAIGIDARNWIGRCHEISSLALAKGFFRGGVLCYGIWHGPINIGSPFFFLRSQGEEIAHGWVETAAQVFDPTRWVFENQLPYIYHGPNDFYSARRQMGVVGEPPLFRRDVKRERRRKKNGSFYTAAEEAYLKSFLLREDEIAGFSDDEWFWLMALTNWLEIEMRKSPQPSPPRPRAARVAGYKTNERATA